VLTRLGFARETCTLRGILTYPQKKYQVEREFLPTQERRTAVKGTRHSQEQIIAILKQGEAGLATAELCWQHGVSELPCYRWKTKCGGMDSGEAKRLKQLKEAEATEKRLKQLKDENRKLRDVAAELTLDNRARKDVLSKNCRACGTSGSRELHHGAVPRVRA